jgi:hypothetical protein
VGGKGKQGVDPGLAGRLLRVGEKLGNLLEIQVEALPEFFGVASAGDPLLDLLPGLKRRLLARLGVAKALGGKLPGGDACSPTSAPVRSTWSAATRWIASAARCWTSPG